VVELGDFLRRLFAAAVAAADPAVSLARHLPGPPRGRTVVIGAGKAAASMARAVEAAWPGKLSGLVVTRYGHGAPTQRIEVVEAGHPVPDAAGTAAARSILDRVAGLDAGDLVICLISGGGSALLSLPAPGLILADKQAVNRALLKSGADIGEMNCVRRHLSATKGGRLAAACHPARVVTLLISDTPEDDPLDIGSGPTLPNPTTCAEALAILARYRIEIPSSVRAHLGSCAGESAKPGDPRLDKPDPRMVATPLMALEAAADLAQRAGVAPLIHGDAIEGEAREVGGSWPASPGALPPTACRWRRPVSCSPAARQRSPAVGLVVAVATSSSCLHLAPNWPAIPASTLLPATPTASTVSRRSQARSSAPTHLPGRLPWGSASVPASTGTTGTASSRL
jgi:hydroxypyruvate reductase/glycerate 2-kinase